MSESTYGPLLKKLKKGQIKACLIQQHGEIAFSYYKNQKAESALHPIHSASKSVTSMLVGICLGQGLIPGLDVPIQTYFGAYFAAHPDPQKEAITLYHLLTMTSGLDWREFGEWNYWSPMEFSRDIVGSALDRPMEVDPGIKMNYNSGSSNLLSAVIGRASGRKASDFARQYLFGPLGIEDFLWHEKQGISLGANGLRMKAADLLRLGALYLQKGRCKGVQVLPEDWVLDSARPRFCSYPHIGHYGLHWWMSEVAGEDGQPIPFSFAMGLFGQFLILVPAWDMAAVFLSENGGDTLRPMQLFREHVASVGPN